METTFTLRNRLGFNEVALWKQFCARRLHLIHTLSLNLRKASEQEEQVRVLAAELCAEYGFGRYAQGDFEKLLIAGIQSVRRNQKRSARHPGGFSDAHRSGDQAKTPASNTSQLPSSASSTKQTIGISRNSALSSTISSPQFGDGAGYTLEQHYTTAHEPALSSSTASEHTTEGGNVVTSRSSLSNPLFQSLVVRLDVLRDMISTGAATWIESSAPKLAHMSAYGVLSTAVAAASIHGKLTALESSAMRDSILEGPLLESLRLVLDPSLTQTRLLERIGALAASLVHGPNLLSALQALCVSLAQASHGSENEMRSLLKQLVRSEDTNSDQKRSQSSFGQHKSPIEHGQDVLVPAATHEAASAAMLPIQPRQSVFTDSHGHPPANDHHNLPGPQTRLNQGAGFYQLEKGPDTATIPTIDILPTAPQGGLSVHSANSGQAESTPLSNTINAGSPQHTGSPDGSQPTRSRSSDESLSSAQSLSASSSASSVSTMGIRVGGPDRLVTLQFNERSLKLTYSPMKATPPTISEIIDNARKSFSIPVSTVVRIKDVKRNKIIETNSELIDAFSQQEVMLELLLPPPMLMAKPMVSSGSCGDTKFTHLAPIFRKSV